MREVEVLGLCPVHGRQVFRREPDLRWWACPLTSIFAPDECGYIIPDESLTPDGGEVVHIDRVQFIGGINAERRVVMPQEPGDDH